jgi:hypothetical protein
MFIKGWLVPHGYLSEDEGVDEDPAEKKPISKDSPKKKVQVLVPILIGPFIDVAPDEQSLQILKPLSVKFLFGTPRLI